MQKDSAFFEDLSKMATGAAGAMLDVKRELESMVKSQVESLLERMHLVSREEFDVVKAMAEKAREENEELKARLDKIESNQ